MNKEERINVYKHTYDNAKNYHTQKSYDYVISHIKEYPENKIRDNIYIVKYDMFDLAEIYKNNKVCILNMACWFKPGGGVEDGCTAQEETMFRRSNYVLTLDSKYYPIQNKIIFSPIITFFKDSKYNVIQPFYCSAIACSAIENPNLINNRYLDSDRMIMDEKINKIFCVAITNNIEILILSAFGCGAYNNPPEEVAKIMNKYSKKYSGYFKKIYIAILDDKYTNNYNIFNKIFS
jgi:uncharacterized protein (TIGR02452 family)